jgi:amidase
MAIRRPDTQDVTALAASYGMHPGEDAVATYTALIDGSLVS